MTTIIKTFTLFLSLTIGFSSHATILTVKQDGTGDYTIIQYAINNAVDGDTVLVWPGIYYENVDFIGKNITMASLLLTTGDETYRYNTIIDGNNNGSCVVVMSGETNAIINGFTIQHGSGTNFAHPVLHYGGGIFTNYSICSIINCVIIHNYADGGGGGIQCGRDSYVFLAGTSINNNHGSGGGGGIACGYESTIEFSEDNLCSVYLNYAERGCDLVKGEDDTLTIYLDTCTVLNPDNYYFTSVDIYGYPVNDIIFNIQNSVITPKDADLYVNPQIGDNNNSGLTPADPLKSIAFAYSSIVIDSVNKNTIHLADGIYSDSSNNEKYPLNIRPYINVVGESRNNTILDGMYKSLMIKGNNEVSNYSYRNMTMYRGGFVHPDEDIGQTGFAYLYVKNDNLFFDSILFKNGHGYSHMGVFNFGAENNAQIKNCEFIDNIGAHAIRCSNSEGDTITISNCIFDNNLPDYHQAYVRGGALSIYTFDDGPVVVKGCLFTNNNNDNVQSASSFHPGHTFFVNCTFTQNTILSNIRPLGSIDANLNMYNCIIYDNGGEKTVKFGFNETTDTISLEIYNSLIEGEEESIDVEQGMTKLHYDETNIDADPLFYGGAEYPYNLSDLSPCIDAGTLDLPEWIELPETDLAGNPRIVGAAIDMGAYEWNPTVGVNEYQSIKKVKEKLLTVAPNPFSTKTIINASFPVKSHVKLEVYNNYGQRVKVFMNEVTLPGESHIVWDGDDYNNHTLPTGIYHVVMFVDDNEIESVKVVKLTK